MGFTGNIRRFLENSTRYVIVGGFLLLALGLYSWIRGHTYDGIFIILLGLNGVVSSFIDSSFIAWKWMLLCSVVTLGLAVWMALYKL